MDETRMDYEERFMADIMNRLITSDAPRLEQYYELAKCEIMESEAKEIMKEKQLALLDKAFEKVMIQIVGEEVN